MNNATAIAVFLSVQAAIVALDLSDLWRRRRASQESARLAFSAVAFLMLVSLVFFSVQWAGARLFPSQAELFTLARERIAQWSGKPLAAAPMPGGLQLALAAVVFYVAGLCDYLVHRRFSHSRLFWFTHEYHHLPKEINVLMPGIFTRPFGFLPVFLAGAATAGAVYVPLWAAGLPLWDMTPILPALLLIVVVLTASHSSFLRRCPLAHRGMRLLFLTTPQEHLLHHTCAMDVNYGNFTTLWDRVFGTYRDPLRRPLANEPLGLPYDQDFLGTLTLGAIKLPAAVRRRFQVDRWCNLAPRAEPIERNMPHDPLVTMKDSCVSSKSINTPLR